MKTITTRSTLTALALASTVLAASWGSAPTAAHAAALASSSARYQIAVPGARVVFDTTTSPWIGGGVLYNYNVHYATGGEGGYFVGVLPTRAATLEANGFAFTVAKRSFIDGSTVRSSHQNGVWVVYESSDSECRVSMGFAAGHYAISSDAISMDGYCAGSSSSSRALAMLKALRPTLV